MILTCALSLRAQQVQPVQDSIPRSDVFFGMGWSFNEPYSGPLFEIGWLLRSVGAHGMMLSIEAGLLEGDEPPIGYLLSGFSQDRFNGISVTCAAVAEA